MNPYRIIGVVLWILGGGIIVEGEAQVLGGFVAVIGMLLTFFPMSSSPLPERPPVPVAPRPEVTHDGGAAHIFDDVRDEFRFIASGSGLADGELNTAAIVAVAWGERNASAAVPYVLAGLGDFHRLALSTFAEPVAETFPDESQHRAHSRAEWMRVAGIAPGELTAAIGVLEYIEQAVERAPEILGPDGFTVALSACRARVAAYAETGLPLPGPWVTGHHLWSLGFAVGLTSSGD